MTCPVYEPQKPRRKRSALKRQRMAILISLIVVALLAGSFAVVYHFTIHRVVGGKYMIVFHDVLIATVVIHIVAFPVVGRINIYSVIVHMYRRVCHIIGWEQISFFFFHKAFRFWIIDFILLYLIIL